MVYMAARGLLLLVHLLALVFLPRFDLPTLKSCRGVLVSLDDGLKRYESGLWKAGRFACLFVLLGLDMVAKKT